MHILTALKVLFWPHSGSRAVTPWKWSITASITVSMRLAEQGFQLLELTVVNPVISGSDLLKDHPEMKAATSAMAT